MDAAMVCILATAIASGVGSLLGKFFVKGLKRWSDAIRLLVSTIGLVLISVFLYLLSESEGFELHSTTEYAFHTTENEGFEFHSATDASTTVACLIDFSSRTGRKLVSMLLSLFLGASMGRLYADMLQNCVRPVGMRRVVAPTIGFAMVLLLTIILHNYVIRFEVCRVIGFVVGRAHAEFVYQLFQRMYHGFANRQLPVQAPLQVGRQVVRVQIHIHRL